MNTFIKAALVSAILGFGTTVAAGPNGGLADRVSEARSYPNKTVDTVRPDHQAMMRMMQKMHAAEGSMDMMNECMAMMRKHMNKG